MNNSLSKNGYIIISSKKISNLKKKIRSCILKACMQIIKLNIKKPKKILNFDDAITYMYEQDKKFNKNLISKLYDIAPDLYEIHEVTTNKTLISIVKRLGIEYPTVGTNITLRLDRPNDKKLKTTLHQDIWYSMISDNSLTIWFNVSKLSKIDGPLQVCKTFKKNKIYNFLDNNLGTFTAKLNEEFNFDEIHLNENQILIFSQYLLHKSGNNFSNKPRASIQIRYNDFFKNDNFNKSYKSTLSNHVLINQKKYLI